MDSSTTRRSMESILSKTIQLNNAGVVCLVENNNIEKAVKLFAMAFSNHEKLKLQANRMIITSSSSSRTTATAFNESSSPSPTQQQQQQRSRSTKKQPQHQQLNDLFVRYRHRSSSSSSEEDDNDVVFRDLIRLPSIEDIILMMKCTNNNNSNSNSNAHNNKNNNTEEIEEHEYSQIIGFLSTCHTYNLALAHHLCGLELLRSTTSNSGSSSSSNRNNHIFDRAGRLYELTMRLERTRSKLRQQQQQKQNNDDNNNNNDINTWFTPQILLACLNNLAHLHYRTNNHIRSRTCYLQVQITTKKLWDLKRQQRQGEEAEEEVGINTNNNDDSDCDDDDDGIGNNYFAVFWTNACRGLSRLIASSSSSRSPPRSNNKQQHYVTKSSAAAAA